MSEKELIDVWNRARLHVILAQLAPTFLLITTVGFTPAIREAGVAVSLATWGILLASGILGAIAEFSAAHEAQGVALDLMSVRTASNVSVRIIKTARWLQVVKYVTPAIFVGIFAALTLALFS